MIQLSVNSSILDMSYANTALRQNEKNIHSRLHMLCEKTKLQEFGREKITFVIGKMLVLIDDA